MIAILQLLSEADRPKALEAINHSHQTAFHCNARHCAELLLYYPEHRWVGLLTLGDIHGNIPLHHLLDNFELCPLKRLMIFFRGTKTAYIHK